MSGQRHDIHDAADRAGTLIAFPRERVRVGRIGTDRRGELVSFPTRTWRGFAGVVADVERAKRRLLRRSPTTQRG
ncbi:MAG TPA: hypothetical protein VHM01_07410 [Alphaproteobacteria bacterium]|nr:hypothetical protein [Alphaproteobacteria bacterium]